MGDEAALRLLELVRHKLAAADARIEIGGHPPEATTSAWVALNPNRRLVATFAGEAPKDAGRRLAALVDAFAASAGDPATDGPVALARRTLPVEIDAELGGLAVRAKAACAVLIDASSPVVWGRSHADLSEDVGAMLDVAAAVGDADPAVLLAGDRDGWPATLRTHAGNDEASARRSVMAAIGIKAARDMVAAEPKAVGSVHRIVRRGNYAFMFRSLGGVYLLILAFEGGFSEPQAEGVVRRGGSQIEKLIVKLPPTDPPPRPGRVLSLHRPSKG